MCTHNSCLIASSEQPRFFGGFTLKAYNRWVKLAELIPWARVKEECRKNFRGNRKERAKSVRLALGCLVVQELYSHLTVIQYFLGYADYQYDLSLEVSLFTHFRKRLHADVITHVRQWVSEAA